MALSKPPRSWVRGGCLGRGSFGTVNLAVDGANGELFAVKSVGADSKGSSIKFLENEIEVLKSISPFPYIVAYLGDDVTEEPLVGRLRNLHMEYVPGGNAAEVAVGGRMADGDVRSYTRCIVEALLHLSSSGIVHGDVKGRNVLVSHRNRIAKLADFGSARRLVGVDGGRVLGTPLWTAPEVARGEIPTAASDVWSLGCTVIEMASGQSPWTESGFDDPTHALLHIGFGGDVPQLPPQLQKTGRDFVEKCLRRDPGERWSCEELLRHPYVSAVEQSPRSVLEWANADLDVAQVGCSTFGSEDSGSGPGTICETDSIYAVKRLAELAGAGGALWRDLSGGDDDDHWEVVRSSGSEEEERLVVSVTSCLTSPPPPCIVTATIPVECFGTWCGHLQLELLGTAGVRAYPHLFVLASLCGNNVDGNSSEEKETFVTRPAFAAARYPKFVMPSRLSSPLCHLIVLVFVWRCWCFSFDGDFTRGKGNWVMVDAYG